MNAPILGLHHVTAIASDPQRNLDFYAGVLGLRLVKLTVNFDDLGTYHFYFGDEQGSPGTILTFFPWLGARRGQIGNGQATVTSYAVPGDSLFYWQERLTKYGARQRTFSERFGERGIALEDPDGLLLELIADDNDSLPMGWSGGGVPAENAITRFHSVTMAVEGYEHTARLLTESLGFRLASSEENRFRYVTHDGGTGAMVDVLCQPYGQQGRMGAGVVHHIAWRVADDSAQISRRMHLLTEGYNVSPVMDRNYFHSIYFREPGGVLFEIATDPPGFTADEPLESLGTSLKLPLRYESRRAEIERVLPPLQMPKE